VSAWRRCPRQLSAKKSAGHNHAEKRLFLRERTGIEPA
jgi:hypothetical protein